METGDKVLVLLLAKVACCVDLALAAAGVLGGVGVWLIDGAGRWVVGAALVGLIAAVLPQELEAFGDGFADGRTSAPGAKPLEPGR